MAKKDLKIFILDDDFEITRSVSTYLEQLGYIVKALNSPESCLETIQDFKPDLVILDIILPEINGIELCQMIRRLPTYYPIIMLTSKADVVDKVVGLEVGADDYVPKPFSLRELEARIKAVLRRQLLEKKAHDEAVQQTVIQHGRHRHGPQEPVPEDRRPKNRPDAQGVRADEALPPEPGQSL